MASLECKADVEVGAGEREKDVCVALDATAIRCGAAVFPLAAVSCFATVTCENGERCLFLQADDAGGAEDDDGNVPSTDVYIYPGERLPELHSKLQFFMSQLPCSEDDSDGAECPFPIHFNDTQFDDAPDTKKTKPE